jgi:hypothetical protein
VNGRANRENTEAEPPAFAYASPIGSIGHPLTLGFAEFRKGIATNGDFVRNAFNRWRFFVKYSSAAAAVPLPWLSAVKS